MHDLFPYFHAQILTYDLDQFAPGRSGGLLKNEIINFIQSADTVIADITNERPNVYLEIGYAMGIDNPR